MIRFSVIIPLYNKEQHIANTIACVLAQTYTNYEVIVVNDGSTDNSLSIVNGIKSEKIHIFNTQNQGVSAARNFGIQQAKGNYCAFLDADDLWKPNHLKELSNLINHYPECSMYATNYEFDHGHFKVQTQFPTLPLQNDWNGVINDYFTASLVNRITWTSATAISKDIIKEVGLFNIHFTHGEDTEFWSRIALKHSVAFSKKITAIYKLNSENRACNQNTNQRKTVTFEAFKDAEKTNIALKKYLDHYRYEYALIYKVNQNLKQCNFYLKDINWDHISNKKKLLIKLPSFILTILWQVKQWLKTKGFDFYI